MRFRCLVCGKVHRSDIESEGRSCLQRLVDDCGWRVYPGFNPPPLPHSPAFSFLDEVWRQYVRDNRPVEPRTALLPGRAVLALDPAADVEAEVGAYLDEISRPIRRWAREAWDAWRAFVRWKGELLAARPPAEVTVTRLDPEHDGLGRVRKYVVRPLVAVPPPLPGEVAVLGVSLEEALARMLPRSERVTNFLAGLAYRSDEFVAVMVTWRWERGAGEVWNKRHTALAVYREPYGRCGSLERVEPGQDIAPAVRRILSGCGR